MGWQLHQSQTIACTRPDLLAQVWRGFSPRLGFGKVEELNNIRVESSGLGWLSIFVVLRNWSTSYAIRLHLKYRVSLRFLLCKVPSQPRNRLISRPIVASLNSDDHEASAV